MTEAEYQQADIKHIEPPAEPEKPAPLAPDLETYLAVLEAMKRPKRHLTAAPTFIPQNLAEQIQFYDDGTNRRVYFYINKTWRYATLT